MKAPERVSDTPGANASSFHQPPTSASSEIVFTSRDQRSKSKESSADGRNRSTKNWRRTWIYSPGEGELYSNFSESDDAVLRCNVRTHFEESKTPPDSFSPNDSLYFTIAESPVVGRGEVTLRFIENPLEGPLSCSENPSVPVSPEIL